MESQPSGTGHHLKEINSRGKKRQRRTYFTLNEKQMIINVYKYVEDTWPADEYPYRTAISEKTAHILGIAVASVYKIIKQYTADGDIRNSPSNEKRFDREDV